MNVYLHDWYVHAGQQFVDYGSFRSTSCEQDESIFRTVKDILRNCSNFSDDVIITILLRLATTHKQHIEYGWNKTSRESSLRKVWNHHEYCNWEIPNDFLEGKERETFFWNVKIFGFSEDKWWEVKESSTIFFTNDFPIGIDVDVPDIACDFWKGADRVSDKNELLQLRWTNYNSVEIEIGIILHFTQDGKEEFVTMSQVRDLKKKIY